MMVTDKTIDYRKLKKNFHDIEVAISLIKSEAYQEEIRKYRTSKTKIMKTVQWNCRSCVSVHGIGYVSATLVATVSVTDNFTYLDVKKHLESGIQNI
jgi:hypothetical protein